MLCVLQASYAQAQTTSFGIQTELAQPMFASQTLGIDILPGVEIPLNFVDFGEANNMGFGLSAKLQQTFANNKAAFNVKAGFINWKVADEGLISAKVKAIPITIGGRYYVYDGLYVGADVGATRVTSKVKATFLISLSKSDPQTLLTLSPNVGYEFTMGKSKVDIGAKYAYVGNKFNYFGLTAGINFPFSK